MKRLRTALESARQQNIPSALSPLMAARLTPEERQQFAHIDTDSATLDKEMRSLYALLDSLNKDARKQTTTLSAQWTELLRNYAALARQV